MSPRPPVFAALRSALALGAALAAATPAAAQASLSPAQGPEPALLGVATRAADAAGRLFGYSGSLRVAVVRMLETLDLPFIAEEQTAGGVRYRWAPLFGTRPTGLLGEALASAGVRAPDAPGMWRLEGGSAYLGARGAPLTVITQVPFSQKKGGRLNGYNIGRYSTEGSGRTDRYAPPEGFIEVTPENQEMQISEHFRLKQFLTKDQFNVWPKYVAIDLRQIDKLELVIRELNGMGVRVDRVHVMSGYRTPQYNGPGEGGRAKLSRHTYGDAADLWVDNDGDGYMDDLNGDGRRDINDAAVILKAVDRVEAKYPDLVGGAGLYPATSAHGPFIHIDTRGTRARW